MKIGSSGRRVVGPGVSAIRIRMGSNGSSGAGEAPRVIASAGVGVASGFLGRMWQGSGRSGCRLGLGIGGTQSRCADVAGVSPVAVPSAVRMWQGWAGSGCRLGLNAHAPAVTDDLTLRVVALQREAAGRYPRVLLRPHPCATQPYHPAGYSQGIHRVLLRPHPCATQPYHRLTRAAVVYSPWGTPAHGAGPAVRPPSQGRRHSRHGPQARDACNVRARARVWEGPRRYVEYGAWALCGTLPGATRSPMRQQ
jgi:hypothetical protein